MLTVSDKNTFVIGRKEKGETTGKEFFRLWERSTFLD